MVQSIFRDFLKSFQLSVTIIYLGKDRASYEKGISSKNAKYTADDLKKAVGTEHWVKVLSSMRSRRYRQRKKELQQKNTRYICDLLFIFYSSLYY